MGKGPTCGYEKGVALIECDTVTLLNCLPKEDVPLLPGEHPLLVQLKVALSWWD